MKESKSHPFSHLRIAIPGSSKLVRKKNEQKSDCMPFVIVWQESHSTFGIFILSIPVPKSFVGLIFNFFSYHFILAIVPQSLHFLNSSVVCHRSMTGFN